MKKISKTTIPPKMGSKQEGNRKKLKICIFGPKI